MYSVAWTWVVSVTTGCNLYSGAHTMSGLMFWQSITLKNKFWKAFVPTMWVTFYIHQHQFSNGFIGRHMVYDLHPLEFTGEYMYIYM